MEDLYRKLIRIFDTHIELDNFLAELLIAEFQKPGLILLPIGSTFEQGIYPQINSFFGVQNKQNFNSEKLIEISPHPELRISHLDELILSPNMSFSDRLYMALPELLSRLGDNFYPINPKKLDSYDRWIKSNGGPRLIVLGLGEDPEKAHIAFMGEEYINTSTAIVKLGLTASAQHSCVEALSIGSDIFELPKLERIIVVAKGQAKQASLSAAFDDPDTGLGYLIKHHSSKLIIYADAAAGKII